MTAPKRKSNFAVISLLISLLGLGLLPFLMLNPPPSFYLPWQNQIIGIAFSGICILGIIAGISPTHCGRPQKNKKNATIEETGNDQPTPTSDSIQKRGHHPTCTNFVSHVVQLRSRILCAGCTGLVVGALLAVIGSTLFFFGNLILPSPLFFFLLGWGCVALGLLQHFIYQVFHVNRGEIRLLVNVVFVFGAFLLLATLMQLTASWILGAYLIVLILYWIFTRIVMSRRSHQRICAQCGKRVCPLSVV
jgi:hypothetical protein